jgi:MFS family permease
VVEARSLVGPARVRAEHPFLAAAAGVFAATLCAFLAVGAVLPVLPRYVRGPIGAGDVAVGVVVGAFAFTAVVTRPWAGRLADSRGRRPVVVAGLLGMALAGALLYVPAGVPGLIVARCVLGAAEGFVFTGASTWIVDLAPEDRRAQSIGLFGLAIWGGLSVGPLIGEALRALGGYGAVWAFAVLGPLAGAAIAARQPAAPPPVEHFERGRLIPRETVGPGIALALANAGYATMAAFVALRVGSHGAAVFTAFAASVVATRLALGRLPDRVGPRATAVAAGCAESAGLAIIALSGSWVPALAGGIVMGWGFSLLYPSLALVVVERVGEARRGAALGAFTAFFDAGVGLGGPLAGAVAALAGYGAAFWVAAGLAALAAVIAARVAGPRPVSPCAA